MNRLLRLALCLSLFCGAFSAGFARAGTIESVSLAPPAGLTARRIIVWLPDDYKTSDQVYGVLYMHDAQNIIDPKTAMGGHPWGADKAVERLATAHPERRLIIVGIDNGPNRGRDYLPEKIVARLPDAARARLAERVGGLPLSDVYLDFIVNTVKPHIDRTYRTRPGREATLIMGSSMGGLISLYALLEHPDVFGGAGCLSTHWLLETGGFLSRDALSETDRIAAIKGYILDHKPRLPVRLWTDHGDRGLDSRYSRYQSAIADALVTAGWTLDRDFVSRFYPGADHNEQSWRARLDDPLGYLTSMQ